jgi:hypothetical protein
MMNIKPYGKRKRLPKRKQGWIKLWIPLPTETGEEQ